jgi:hypothetical protein
VFTSGKAKRGSGIRLAWEQATKPWRMHASPADWISPFGQQFKTDPPATDGKKVSVSDTDHIWGFGATVPRAWKSFIRGHNTMLMDPWQPVAGRICQEDLAVMKQPGAPHRDVNYSTLFLCFRSDRTGHLCQDTGWMVQPGSPHRDLNHRDDPTWNRCGGP